MSIKNHINRFPCKFCITLPICKAIFYSEFEQSYKITSDVVVLTDKCSILDMYIYGKGGTSMKAYEKKYSILYNFFKGLKK